MAGALEPEAEVVVAGLDACGRLVAPGMRENADSVEPFVNGAGRYPTRVLVLLEAALGRRAETAERVEVVDDWSREEGSGGRAIGIKVVLSVAPTVVSERPPFLRLRLSWTRI